MKIVINKTKRLLFVGKTMISTGTNVMAEDFDADNANVKAWVKAKMVSVKDTDKMSEDELVEAIETAYDNAVVDAIKKVSKSKKVQDEAKEQKAENDKKDSELDAAIEEAKKAAGKKKD